MYSTFESDANPDGETSARSAAGARGILAETRSILSQLSPTETVSTDSVQTVRGNNDISSPSVVLRTSSFPFNTTGIGLETSSATPPIHSPFTALSPTILPSSREAKASRLAKKRVAEEFKARGRMITSASSNVEPTPNAAGFLLPDAYEIAIRIQTEPGLTGWWQQVTQILKESFSATRATLAIPSDRTEIENVPWAQSAEFFAPDDDDSISRTTRQAASTRNSISGSFMTEPPSPGSLPQDITETTSKLPITATLGRPKLDTRHSYAGYPRRSPVAEIPSTPLKRPRPSRAESQAILTSGLTDSKTILDLDRYRPILGENLRSPLSEATASSSRSSARVLMNPRPLEADTQPLITSAGVVRVLNNSSATILTRRYNVLDESSESSPKSPRLLSRGSQTQLFLHGAEAKSSLRTVNRARSGTGSTTRSSTASNIGTSREYGEAWSSYEDFEQVPGTPWAQSPAPSPAAMAETEDNPFFSPASMEQSFLENPPNQQYTSGQHYEAIGLDTSRSIIQLPLIHPSTLLSQPQRLHRFRVDKGRNGRGDTTGRSTKPRQRSTERKRKVPLAILSVLVPTVPFPQEFVQLLNSLSPMLATSFYAASQHSNLQKEVSGLVHERNRAVGRLPSKIQRTESYGSEILSPMSVSSTDYSATNLMNPQVYENIANDKLVKQIEKSRVKTPGPRTPTSVSTRDGYFAALSLQEENRQEQATPSRHSSTRSKQNHHSAFHKKPQSTLHSQGASFQKTHPALPPATSLGQSEDEQSETDAGSRAFKEPSSSMLRSMIDIGATQHLIAEPDSGRLLWVNSKFQAYRNNSVGRNLDDQLWNNIYHKDRKNFRREWLHALETGEQLSQQVRMERFDGQFRWFHLKFLPLKNDLGVIKYWSGQAMDIHDLHEAEVKAAKSKEKSASEARYRAIANSLPVIVFAASVPAGMTFANTQWLSYSGQSLEQALGFGFLEHVHPEDLNKCRFPGFDDRASASSTLKHDPKVTLRRAELRRNHSSTSSGGHSEATSAATENTVKVLDNSPAEQSADLQIPNDLLKGLASEGIILCARDGQGNLSITTEMRLKSKADEYRWHLVQGSYIQSVNFGQGDAQWFIACTDISTQKRNESKIQEANSALESVNATLEGEMQRKMGYLSSMSHEIRTPLNSIIGNLQFLVQSGLEESALEWAHGAKEAATGMHELINDILDLSKAEAKMLKLQSHWFNPRDLGEQIMDILNAKAAGKKVELCQETLHDVPYAIRGDSGRIKQVLLNLATNAIKFTNEGEVIIRCELQRDLPPQLELPPLKDNEMFIHWAVTDTGIGFTEADKKLLFKAYSQIKNKATRDTMGTGLGLTLCKTMVKLHGGKIDATSRSGRGSTFSFFARFRVRPDSINEGGVTPALSNPVVSGTVPLAAKAESTTQANQSPVSLRPSIASQDSSALGSDSSSALSIRSSSFQKSIRSSMSTFESPRPQSPLKLSLPINELSPTEELSETGGSPIFSATVHKLPQKGAAPPINDASQRPIRVDVQKDEISDSDRASFRPPMLSILVICPPRDTRRITCETIQSVVPRSAPCHIASQSTFGGAYELLFAEEPVLFTHIVIRTVTDVDAMKCVKKLLASSNHSKACIVVLTDQDQFISIKKGLPEVNFDVLNQADRVKKVLKPAHPSKLAKIFDPFNENRTVTDDPKENKRKAGERRTKEDFKLFKKAFGGKDIRVLAVEDDKMQMNVSLLVKLGMLLI